jgi:hypothetical protein
MKKLVPLVLLIFLHSCAKDRLIGDKKILVGTWNWRSSLIDDSCVGWTDYTPESTGKMFHFVFTKKGTIQFYENSTLLSEHNVKFDELDIQKEGIVESFRELSFSIELDGDPENMIYGSGTPDDFQVINFPYTKDGACVERAYNYFRKE